MQPGRLWSRRPCLHCLLRSRQSQCTAVTLGCNLWRLVDDTIIHRRGGSVFYGFQIIFGIHCTEEYLTNWCFTIVNVMLYLEEWVIRMSEWKRSQEYRKIIKHLHDQEWNWRLSSDLSASLLSPRTSDQYLDHWSRTATNVIQSEHVTVVLESGDNLGDGRWRIPRQALKCYKENPWRWIHPLLSH